jgi:hypothetical protein
MRNSLTLICVLCCWFGMDEEPFLHRRRQRQDKYARQRCWMFQPCQLRRASLTAAICLFSNSRTSARRAARFSLRRSPWCRLRTPTTSPSIATRRIGDPGYETESRPQVLEPGAWAHLLFVWTSRAGPELSCDLYSGVRLGFSYQWQGRTEPSIEIRHLWIRACGPFAVTGYRPGRYSSASPVPQSWLGWYGPGGLHEFTVPSPTTSTEIVTASPLLSLGAQAKRTMLGDRLFSLKLNFPRTAAEGCAFSQLRKRESDGTTVISLQQCDDVALDKNVGPSAVPWYHEPGVMGLAMGNLDFTPKNVGPLEYDITAPVGRGAGQKATVQYARGSTSLCAIPHSRGRPSSSTLFQPAPRASCGSPRFRQSSLRHSRPFAPTTQLTSLRRPAR